MELHSNFDIPLDALTTGVHLYAFQLNSSFFEAFESTLLKGGEFEVELEVERVRNQFNLSFSIVGKAQVDCDRCLNRFALPLSVSEELVIKYDSDNPRVEELVTFVPYGEERFNVAKVFLDALGLALPISVKHEDANLACDADMLRYLQNPMEDAPLDDNQSANEIPEDSPWSVLQGLRSKDK